MGRRAVTACLVSLMVVGLFQCGQGAWIYGKARLAQHLLMRAWVVTVDGQQQVKPWPWADTWPVARLRAPRHGVDVIVLAGASGRTLAFGPAIVDGGEGQRVSGTMLISGHRDTHFRFVRNLNDGDEVTIERPGQPIRTYRITATQVIDSRTTGLINDPDRDHLLLITCYPFDSLIPGGPLRYVVTAELASHRH